VAFIELRGVGRTVSRADEPPLAILSDLDLVIEAGDRTSIVGRSGSGKSTLLNLLGLLDTPTEGEVLFEGAPTAGIGSRRRDLLRGGAVGFIFQQFNLLPGRTALENVAMPLLYERGRAFWRRKAIAAQMLERVGLHHRMTSTPDRLSGGEQQRVAIARALVRSPRLILADEPTGALDLETGEKIMELLDSIATASDAALVTITHDPAIAALSAHQYLLAGGRLEPVEPVGPVHAVAAGGRGGALRAERR